VCVERVIAVDLPAAGDAEEAQAGALGERAPLRGAVVAQPGRARQHRPVPAHYPPLAHVDAARRVEARGLLDPAAPGELPLRPGPGVAPVAAGEVEDPLPGAEVEQAPDDAGLEVREARREQVRHRLVVEVAVISVGPVGCHNGACRPAPRAELAGPPLRLRSA